MVQAACRLEQIHNLLKGKILMDLCFYRRVLNARQQLFHCRRSRQVNPERHRIDEEADQAFYLRSIAIGIRNANHDIFLIGKPGQNQAPSSKNSHE